MAEASEFDMRIQLRGIGIISVTEQDRVMDVARRCARTGVVLGTAWMILGAPAFAPGALAGFLSGFVTGTATCMGLSYSGRDVLRRLGNGTLEAP